MFTRRSFVSTAVAGAATPNLPVSSLANSQSPVASSYLTALETVLAENGRKVVGTFGSSFVKVLFSHHGEFNPDNCSGYPEYYFTNSKASMESVIKAAHKFPEVLSAFKRNPSMIKGFDSLFPLSKREMLDLLYSDDSVGLAKAELRLLDEDAQNRGYADHEDRLEEEAKYQARREEERREEERDAVVHVPDCMSMVVYTPLTVIREEVICSDFTAVLHRYRFA